MICTNTKKKTLNSENKKTQRNWNILSRVVPSPAMAKMSGLGLEINSLFTYVLASNVQMFFLLARISQELVIFRLNPFQNFEIKVGERMRQCVRKKRIESDLIFFSNILHLIGKITGKFILSQLKQISHPNEIHIVCGTSRVKCPLLMWAPWIQPSPLFFSRPRSKSYSPW
jgi:hypothetical protein